MRRIAVVTSSRADYGLLKPLLCALARRRGVRVQLIATGSHLDERFGRTIREIASDGWKTAAQVPLRLRGDRPRDIAEALGRATSGFAAAYARLRPDILVVLGDRWEILAAASAALPFRLPVAHIHGGEATEGLIDEQVRHAVTKLSHLHFPVTRIYRARILAMGEDPRRVFCFGAPGLDGLDRTPFWTRERLAKELALPPRAPLGVLTYHPVTLDPTASRREVAALLAALPSRRDLFWVLTLPNVEAGFAPVISALREFVRRHPGRAAAFPSLGRLRYLSLLRCARVMAGNSSSGIIEAASFGLPVVNVGSRQDGRTRARNVLDVPAATAASVRRALRRALSPAFARSLRGLRNPYAGRDACARIARVLVETPLDRALLSKRLRTP